MQIEVRLFATLRAGRFNRQTLELPDGTTVAALLSHLGLRSGEVAILLVNGRDAIREKALQAGDAVSLFPAIGGG